MKMISLSIIDKMKRTTYSKKKNENPSSENENNLRLFLLIHLKMSIFPFTKRESMKRNIYGSDCVFETQVVDFENLQRKIYDSFHFCFSPLESIVGILHKRKEKKIKKKKKQF